MVSSAGMGIDPVSLEASPDEAVAPGVTLSGLLKGRQAAYAGIALVTLGIAALLPVTRIARLIPGGQPDAADADEVDAEARHAQRVVTLAVGTVCLLGVLALVYVPGLGLEAKGAARWVQVPVLGSAQPSELAKWGLLVLVAWYGGASGTQLRRPIAGLLPAAMSVGLVAGVVVLEDLGTGLLMGLGSVIVLVAAGARVWQFSLLVPPAAAMITGAFLIAPYRWQRVTTFLNPYGDPEDTGYHMIQSMATVAGGGLFGRGLGHGLQKFGYLPEDTTDFLFAVICEELGFFGAALVIALYAVLAGALFSVVKAARHPVCRLLALGVLVTVMAQALINLFVVTGLGPTKGIALPLLSAGGTGWVLTCGALGLCAAIARGTDRDAERDARFTLEPSLA